MQATSNHRPCDSRTREVRDAKPEKDTGDTVVYRLPQPGEESADAGEVKSAAVIAATLKSAPSLSMSCRPPSKSRRHRNERHATSRISFSRAPP
jgi:hypothetical protein